MAEPRERPTQLVIDYRSALRRMSSARARIELLISNARIGADVTNERLAVAAMLRETVEILDPPPEGRLL